MTDDDREYKIALSGGMPGEQANGWDDETLKDDLYKDRARIRYARVAYNVLHHREVTDTGKRILTIALRRVEPVPDSRADAEERELLELFERRTGQATLFPPREIHDRIAVDDPTAGPWPGDPDYDDTGEQRAATWGAPGRGDTNPR